MGGHLRMAQPRLTRQKTSRYAGMSPFRYTSSSQDGGRQLWDLYRARADVTAQIS